MSKYSTKEGERKSYRGEMTSKGVTIRADWDSSSTFLTPSLKTSHRTAVSRCGESSLGKKKKKTPHNFHLKQPQFQRKKTCHTFYFIQ